MNLDKHRQQIDEIDRKILQNISARARLAEDIARVKQLRQEEPEYYRPEREAQVLKRLMDLNEGPLPDSEIKRLFREIMSSCRACEAATKVAYLGPEGTYTHAAAERHFGGAVSVFPYNSIAGVFRAVESGACAYGVVPVENSSEGVVSHTLDEFLRSSLNIIGEIEIPIHHNLLGKANEIRNINVVYAHQQSFAQCRSWLGSNLPVARLVALSSNAEAARLVSKDKEGGKAAIAGRAAAKVYDLEILAANIEDETSNRTRFLIIGHKSPNPSGADKTSLILLADNKPGALHQLLEPFARNEVSMCRIESRPSRRMNWDYVFFVDVNGHIKDDRVKKAVTDLKNNNRVLAVIGSYPADV